MGRGHKLSKPTPTLTFSNSTANWQLSPLNYHTLPDILLQPSLGPCQHCWGEGWVACNTREKVLRQTILYSLGKEVCFTYATNEKKSMPLVTFLRKHLHKAI